MRSKAQLAASPIPHGFLDEVTTLTEAFVRLGTEHPTYACLIFADQSGREETLTLGDLLERATAIRHTLEDRGFAPGDHAVLILPTGAELIAAYCGVLLAGGVPALASTPTQRAAEPAAYRGLIGGILTSGGVRFAYCDAPTAAILSESPSIIPNGAHLLRPEDVAPLPASAVRRPPPPTSPEHVATMQFSSGSTGAPKGIRLSHHAILNNLRAVREGLAITAQDVSVNWIPLYHDMGLIDAFLLPLLSGCPTVLIPTTSFVREPRLWLEALHRYGGTISWAPNFAYALCVQRIRDDQLVGLDLSRWRIAINAAEPVLAHTIDAFTRRFVPYGFRPEAMTPAWGLAENVTIATADPSTRAPRIETIDRAALVTESVARPTVGPGLASVAIGRCLPRCAIEIRDGDRVLGERAVGEVWLRTDSLFVGYHGDAALTARALVDGWLNTGDRGYLSDGDLFFVARGKDLIVIAGEKYAPHDIETAINQVPGVREGCVVAFGVLELERGTEGVAAVVETKWASPADDQAAAADLEALARSIRGHVARTIGVALRHLKLVPPGGIQKTTSGKLARRATRDRYAADFGASV